MPASVCDGFCLSAGLLGGGILERGERSSASQSVAVEITSQLTTILSAQGTA